MGDFAYSQLTNSQSENANLCLIRMSQKLDNLKNIRYDNKRELNYSSENYHNISTWTVYHEFQSTDTILGFKYQITDSTLSQIFNGIEKFDLNKKDSTIKLYDNPTKKSFGNLSALYNSIVTLKYGLHLIIGDETAFKAITDTTINDIQYNLVTINIGKRRIRNLGEGFDAMTTKSNFIYKVIIDKATYLPLEIIQTNDLNNDFIKTSFTNIEPNTNKIAEISWRYSTYLTDYKSTQNNAVPSLPAIGSLATYWRLEEYNKGNLISLSDLKGKVVLLDFWIKSCAPCIESVPHLNDLQNLFKDKDFKIISINSYDSKEDVKSFCQKHKVDYTVLLNGKEIAEKYGVCGFPTFFIIDNTGKIIYSHAGYETSLQLKIEQIIKNAL